MGFRTNQCFPVIKILEEPKIEVIVMGTRPTWIGLQRNSAGVFDWKDSQSSFANANEVDSSNHKINNLTFHRTLRRATITGLSGSRLPTEATASTEMATLG